MNIKRIAILILTVFILFGLMIFIKRIIPGPEKTTAILIRSLEGKNSEKVKSCFTGKALLDIEKAMGGEKGKIFLWSFKDYFKNIIWKIEKTEQIDKNTYSCLLAATGGKEGAKWEFYDEVIFTKEGWFSWKISELPEIYSARLSKSYY